MKFSVGDGTFEYKPQLAIVVAVITGILAALGVVVAQLDTTPAIELVVLAVIAGLTSGLSYYKENAVGTPTT